MKKNDIVTVTVTDCTQDGEGVGKVGTFPLFIKDAVAGDTVSCSIMKLKPTYGYAKLLSVLTPSPDRTEPVCPVSRACGGCQLQSLSYAGQLAFKENRVRQALTRIGGRTVLQDACFHPIIGMQDPWHYRNKAQVPVGTDKDGHIRAGFYAGHTHDIIPMEDCALTFPEAGQVIRAVKAWMEENRIRAYDESAHRGAVRHILIRKGFFEGGIMVCLILRSMESLGKRGSALLADLTARLQAIPGFSTLSVNLNDTPGNVILGAETRTVFGSGCIEDTIDGVLFRISPQSFFQVNPVQTSVLYGKALEYAGLTGQENVFDLYCGIGTISLFLARKARKVYGIEVIDRAVKDARGNALLNGFTNTEFMTGRAEEVLPAWHAAHPDEQIDVIVVDPPRKGCDSACLETMIAMAPSRIVYVSCEPSTLARDLKTLCAGGYTVREVQPVDMFPETVHVETVVLLSRNT